MLLEARDAEHKRRCAAAVQLQAAQRSFRAKRELARRKAMRDGLLLLGPKEHQCVRLFQRCGRRYLACLVVLEAERHRWRCARRIQAYWRGQRCRCAMADTLLEWRRRRNLALGSAVYVGPTLRHVVQCSNAKRAWAQLGLMAWYSLPPRPSHDWPKLPDVGRWLQRCWCLMLLGKSCLDERLVPKSTLSCLNDDERPLLFSLESFGQKPLA